MKADELIQWRQSRNLTLEELGQALGVTKGCLSRWEAGERKIPPFLHLALRCLELEGGELKKRKPNEYQVTEEKIFLSERKASYRAMKKKMKKEGV
ncbi:MAG: helix-turn-helix transcriptional regulator [Nitrospirota bacterium]|nr:helix-turn-helix transcriptional regulator [Nitrospirota bacterium]